MTAKYKLPDGSTDWRQMMMDEGRWDHRLRTVPAFVAQEMAVEIESLRGKVTTLESELRNRVGARETVEEIESLRRRVRDLVAECGLYAKAGIDNMNSVALLDQIRQILRVHETKPTRPLLYQYSFRCPKCGEHQVTLPRSQIPATKPYSFSCPNCHTFVANLRSDPRTLGYRYKCGVCGAWSEVG